ncbi:MAG: hypothetical protein QUS12_10865 [Methanosarcina sp.]|nr:hypothetical protein [Methanosarcina sp.]
MRPENMLAAFKIAEEMIKAGINGYFLAGLQGVLIGLVFGIELIITVEILINGKNSRILNFIKKFKKSSEA